MNEVNDARCFTSILKPCDVRHIVLASNLSSHHFCMLFACNVPGLPLQQTLAWFISSSYLLLFVHNSIAIYHCGKWGHGAQIAPPQSRPQFSLLHFIALLVSFFKSDSGTKCVERPPFGELPSLCFMLSASLFYAPFVNSNPVSPCCNSLRGLVCHRPPLLPDFEWFHLQGFSHPSLAVWGWLRFRSPPPPGDIFSPAGTGWTGGGSAAWLPPGGDEQKWYFFESVWDISSKCCPNNSNPV